MAALEMGGPDPHERELKMDIPNDFLMPAFDHMGAFVDDFAPLAMRAVFWDTSDLRLALGGYVVCHQFLVFPSQTEGAWTVDAPSQHPTMPLLGRAEEPLPGDSSHPPVQAMAMVRGAIGDAELQPTLRVVIERFGQILRLEGAVAEIVHDLVTVLDKEVPCGHFRELALEPHNGNMGIVTRIERELQKAGATRSSSPSTYVSALRLAGRLR